MALLSHDLDLAKVRREGRTQGIDEGRTQGKAEILHGLLKLRFGQPPARFARRRARARAMRSWSSGPNDCCPLKPLKASSSDDESGR